jgi:hypothetical protein
MGVGIVAVAIGARKQCMLRRDHGLEAATGVLLAQVQVAVEVPRHDAGIDPQRNARIGRRGRSLLARQGGRRQAERAGEGQGLPSRPLASGDRHESICRCESLS